MFAIISIETQMKKYDPEYISTDIGIFLSLVEVYAVEKNPKSPHRLLSTK